METWRAIPGYPGYEVSDAGAVRCWRRRNLRAPIPTSPRTVKPVPSKAHGYIYVSLSVDGCVRRERVHKLVLLAFVGPVPAGMECAHEDGDRTNNNLANLSYKTHLDNMRDRDAHGRVPHGAQVHCAKLNEAAACAIYAARGSFTRIAAEFGVGRRVVSLIKRGQAWARATAPMRTEG